MRKNHHGKKDRLVKRVFALCLALAVICTCLVPVFATETGGIAVMPMDGGFAVDTGFGVGGEDAGVAVQPMDGGFAVDTGVDAGTDTGFAVDPMDGGFAVDTGEDADVDTGMTPGTGIVVTPPVVDEGSSSSASTSGPTIITKETEYGTVTEYDWGDSQTTWKDDEITITPNDNLKEDDAAFGVLPIEYHFWLQQLDSFTFDTLSYEAEMAEMSETEYLALFASSEQYPIWHMDTIASTDTISNYKFANPTAKDDPAGENHEFAYWYTVDENGVETEFDPYKSYGSETDTTVNVYAKWKDGTVGSDEEEDVDHEDLVDKNPVPVDLETKASASYEDEDGNTKSVNLPVEVKNLPSAAHSLSVIHMGDDDMQTFYESHEDSFGKMMPILGLKISPKNAKGEKVQLAKGQKATVTVSGLEKLPEIAAMEEEGALTADALKVLHQKDDKTVEKLDVVSYENGTLTFETSSFSPFVIALEYPDQGSEEFDDGGIEIVSIEIDGIEYPNVNDGIATISSIGGIQGDAKVPVGATITLRAKNGKKNYRHTWRLAKDKTNAGEVVFIDSNGQEVTEIVGEGDTYKTVRIKVKKAGMVTISHRYGDPKATNPESNGDELVITVVESDRKSSYNLYVYTQIRDYSQSQGDYYKPHVENKAWNGMAVGTILNVPSPDTYKWKERPDNLLYDTSNTKEKLGTEILVDSGQFPVIPIKQNGSYKDYYYEVAPNESSMTAEQKKNYGGTYTIKWYEVVGVGGANTGKNGSQGDWTDEEEYKSQYTNGVYKSPITFVSDKTMTYHLDGLLLIHDATHINVTFMVQDAGKNTFDLVSDYGGAYTVQNKGDSIQLNTIARPDVKRNDQTEAVYPETKTVDNITYKFYGWYTDENCTQKADFVNGAISTDTTFYAKYVPASANLTVSKTVTGMLGDTNKAFNFTITKADGTSANITEANIETTDNTRAVWQNNGKFTLKNGASITFKNLPSGEYKIVEDDYTGEKYETSYVVDSGDSQSGREAAVKMSGTNMTLAFTNHRKLTPDTGVLLDTLPYIVILAVVAGGGILLMLRKHRKEDD